MSAKLDQSLDQIMTDRRSTKPRARGGRRVGTAKRGTTGAPVGGVTKATATTKAATKTGKAAKLATPAPVGESKIIVSSLPPDVTEQQIKEYFSKTIGSIKRVFLTYGPSGQSRGVATILFSKPDSAQKAVTELNGVKVDNRPMRIEIVVGAGQAASSVPAKGLGDRIAKPKALKKAPAKAPTKATTKTTAAGRRPRRQNRPKKSAEDLDADMMDYWGGGVANGGQANGTAIANGTAQPVVSADTGMDDEIL